jgi:branched-chain amino acid transport system permease protein
MSQFVLALIAGLGVAGAIYAILGAGIVTVFRGSGVINFAHGAIALYTAYTWSELKGKGDLRLPWFDILPTKKLNLPVKIHLLSAPGNAAVAIAISLLMAAALGLLCHVLVFRPLRNSSTVGKVVGSVGVLIYLQAVIELNFGSSVRSEKGFLAQGSFRNFLGLGGSIGKDRIMVAIAAMIIGALLTALFRFTRFGLITKATAGNEKGSVLLGFSPSFVAGLNWIVASVTAGMAGLLFVGINGLNASNAALFVVPALTAALIGNLDSVGIATIGGLAIGSTVSGVTFLAKKPWWPTWAPEGGVRSVLPLLFLAAVLFLRGDKLPIRGTLTAARQARVPLQSKPFLAPGVVLVLGTIGISIFTGSWMVALTTTLVAACLMLSMVVLVGFLGQISLAQLSLAGVAAYSLVRLTSNGKRVSQLDTVVVKGPGLPHPVAIVLAIAITVVIGLIIALPALRIRGIQLAVVTITAVLTLQEFVFKNGSIVGAGAKSNSPVPRPTIFGIDFGVADKKTFLTDRWQFSALALGALVLLLVAVTNLRRSPTGRRFLAVRTNERAAAAAGINVARTKLLGFGISAAIAGVAGVLFAYKFSSIQFENFELLIGLAFLAFAFLGSITTPSGAVLAGFLVPAGIWSFRLSEWFGKNVIKYVAAAGAIGLIFTAIANPEGIVPAVSESFKPLGRLLFGRGKKAGGIGAGGGPSSGRVSADAADVVATV